MLRSGTRTRPLHAPPPPPMTCYPTDNQIFYTKHLVLSHSLASVTASADFREEGREGVREGWQSPPSLHTTPLLITFSHGTLIEPPSFLSHPSPFLNPNPYPLHHPPLSLKPTPPSSFSHPSPLPPCYMPHSKPLHTLLERVQGRNPKP